MSDELITRVAERLAKATHGVAFTGAGISTESGIADFRSPHGIWSRYKPVYFDEFLASHDARKRMWLMNLGVPRSETCCSMLRGLFLRIWRGRVDLG